MRCQHELSLLLRCRWRRRWRCGGRELLVTLWFDCSPSFTRVFSLWGLWLVCASAFLLLWCSSAGLCCGERCPLLVIILSCSCFSTSCSPGTKSTSFQRKTSRSQNKNYFYLRNKKIPASVRPPFTQLQVLYQSPSSSWRLSEGLNTELMV